MLNRGTVLLAVALALLLSGCQRFADHVVLPRHGNSAFTERETVKIEPVLFDELSTSVGSTTVEALYRSAFSQELKDDFGDDSRIPRIRLEPIAGDEGRVGPQSFVPPVLAAAAIEMAAKFVSNEIKKEASRYEASFDAEAYRSGFYAWLADPADPVPMSAKDVTAYYAKKGLIGAPQELFEAREAISAIRTSLASLAPAAASAAELEKDKATLEARVKEIEGLLAGAPQLYQNVYALKITREASRTRTDTVSTRYELYLGFYLSEGNRVMKVYPLAFRTTGAKAKVLRITGKAKQFFYAWRLLLNQSDSLYTKTQIKLQGIYSDRLQDTETISLGPEIEVELKSYNLTKHDWVLGSDLGGSGGWVAAPPVTESVGTPLRFTGNGCYHVNVNVVEKDLSRAQKYLTELAEEVSDQGKKAAASIKNGK